jgi:hypothetical protein
MGIVPVFVTNHRLSPLTIDEVVFDPDRIAWSSYSVLSQLKPITFGMPTTKYRRQDGLTAYEPMELWYEWNDLQREWTTDGMDYEWNDLRMV